MSMSKDRVRFRLASYYFDGHSSAMPPVLKAAFGMDEADIRGIEVEARAGSGTTIQCRPSQFARFLILREKAGFQNMFAELKAELVTFEPVSRIVDVSRNPSNN